MQTATAKATSATVTTRSANRAGHKLMGLLQAALPGLILAAGLIGANPAALADPQPGAGQADSRQSDSQTDKDKKNQEAKKDKGDKGDKQDEHAPTLTLTAPVAGSATLYPAAITVSASIVYPVDDDAGKHNKDASPEHRRNFEVEFLVNGVKFAEAERPPYQASYTPPQAGHYSFTARLRYGEGHRTILSNAVDAVSDTPPSVSLTAPAANSTDIAPANITVSANAASQIGSIARVDFYAATTASGTTINTLIGTATGAPYSYAWSSVPVGSYTLTAVATDSYGFSTTSTPVTVTVKPGELLPYYIHSDQLDTPRQITDTNANVVWQWDNSDPFGNNVPNENPNGAGQFSFSLRFPGQYYDRETNLHYNIFRDYDPAIGRYVESDPIGLMGGINTYTYVHGNPLRWVDPFGLDCGGTSADSTTSGSFNLASNANPENQPGGPFYGGAGGGGGEGGGEGAASGEGEGNASPAPVSQGPAPSPNFQSPTNAPQYPDIPADWIPRPGTSGGTVWQPPGENSDGPAIRIMPPTSQYPNGYWVQTNPSGQPINPSTGGTGPRPDTHIPLPPQ